MNIMRGKVTDMLLLKDLLKFTDEEMKNIKVKFNISHPREKMTQ